MASCATSAKWRIAIVIIQVSLLVVAIGAGIGLGIGVPLTEPFRDAARRSRFLRLLHTPAEVVLRLVGLFFIPLAFASAVSGLGALPWKRCGRSLLCFALCVFALNLLAVGEGLAAFYGWRALSLANVTIWPEVKVNDSLPAVNGGLLEDYVYDIIRTLLPDSVLEVHLSDLKHESHISDNGTGTSEDTAFFNAYLPYRPLPVNYVGLIVFSLLVGLSLSGLQSRGKLLLAVTDGVFDVFMSIFRVLIWLYPLAVLFIVAHTIIVLEDPVKQLKIFWIFWLCVGGVLFFHVIVLLPIVFLVTMRANPFKHLIGCFHAMLTAFCFNDRKAAVPVSIKCLRQLHLERHVTRLAVVMGTVLNHDAILLVTVPVFMLVSSNGLDPQSALQVFLTILSAMAFTLTMTTGHVHTIFTALVSAADADVDFLPHSQSLLVQAVLPFDWLFYRLARAGCVWSDCVTAAIVEKWTVSEGRPFTSASDVFEATGDASLNNDGAEARADIEEDGTPVLTQYDRWQKDWTMKLINETGDKLVISKV